MALERDLARADGLDRGHRIHVIVLTDGAFGRRGEALSEAIAVREAVARAADVSVVWDARQGQIVLVALVGAISGEVDLVIAAVPVMVLLLLV